MGQQYDKPVVPLAKRGSPVDGLKKKLELVRVDDFHGRLLELEPECGGIVFPHSPTDLEKPSTKQEISL